MKRKTSQKLVPLLQDKEPRNSYDIYPAFSTDRRKINVGYKSLTEEISKQKNIILDGYIGVDWKEVRKSIASSFDEKGKKIKFISTGELLKPEQEIKELVAPFLGGDDPVFGKRTSLDLIDFFDKDKLNTIPSGKDDCISIIYGTGASLVKKEGFLVYFDVPKNELQFRMRADAVTNLGFKTNKDKKQTYKHFYFVDWIVLNKEKKKLLPQIDIMVDQQRPENPVWMLGKDLRATLDVMSRNFFRVRPWFEPGVWGGQWMKNKVEQLPKKVPNYAWSFEMIVPENGLLLEDNGVLLEVSFDLLMFNNQKNILGNAAKRFKDEFPIRFDFLDTFKGGNLSVQCHPSTEFIKNEFGENFTQDETYYILDAEKDANVYLGFQEDINPTTFKKELESSFITKKEIDIEKYVQKIPAKKHDLFLIPNQTIHCSGINNLVLEISATPYIFTFKMYDWQRLDLDGKPRPLNIERAFKNLDFTRKGDVVAKTLISKPKVVDSGKDWKKIHLPTHPEHFYEIFRYEFDAKISISTQNQCHVLMLVEGDQILLETEDGLQQHFNYAETFAIPAVAKNYTLINLGNTRTKVIVSFVKETAC